MMRITHLALTNFGNLDGAEPRAHSYTPLLRYKNPRLPHFIAGFAIKAWIKMRRHILDYRQILYHLHLIPLVLCYSGSHNH